MYQQNSQEIVEVIDQYFKGIFTGNIERLKACFVEEAYLYGDIKGEPYLKSLEDYLTGVAGRKSPEELKESFEMKIISLEIQGNIAMARLHVPMLGYNYYDLLSLSRIGGVWKIVNKLFIHVD